MQKFLYNLWFIQLQQTLWGPMHAHYLLWSLELRLMHAYMYMLMYLKCPRGVFGIDQTSPPSLPGRLNPAIFINALTCSSSSCTAVVDPVDYTYIRVGINKVLCVTVNKQLYFTYC